MKLVSKAAVASALADARQSALRGALIGAVIVGVAAPIYLLLPSTQFHFGAHAAARIGAPTRSIPAANAQPMPAADFGLHAASQQVRSLANWVAATNDNADKPFVIVDKRGAQLHVFDAHARLVDSSPVLLGAARGDDNVAGIGNRPIEQIEPGERTTPAGRFLAQRGRNATGEEVVWVDYDAAVSMHRVRTINPAERRLERLASAAPDDHRISYGCINVPHAFFDAHIAPIFQASAAPVYVLPEVKPLEQVFGRPAAGLPPHGESRV